jgi:hypothetical protein
MTPTYKWRTEFREIGGKSGYTVKAGNMKLTANDGSEWTTSISDTASVSPGGIAHIDYWCGKMDGWQGGTMWIPWLIVDDCGNGEIIDQSRMNGKPHGRPRSALNKASEIAKMHAEGVSKSKIASMLGIGRTSVRRILSQPPVGASSQLPQQPDHSADDLSVCGAGWKSSGEWEEGAGVFILSAR